MGFHLPKNKPYSQALQAVRLSEKGGVYGQWTYRHEGLLLRIQASEGAGWEHVSVSLPNRCPSWEEMCAVKDLFWDGEDAVIQFHPPRSNYVSYSKYCLHLWRCKYQEQPLPHYGLVGLKPGQTVGDMEKELSVWLAEHDLPSIGETG